jgi:pimeloyl-ACP methyl ester carboxylesterase
MAYYTTKLLKNQHTPVCYNGAMARTLFYQVEGAGEPIVLLHGFLASSQYFTALRKRLRATHMVIAIDLLGFGRSPKPAASQYTYKEQVRAVHEELTRLGIQKFALVGHSLGALVALRYAQEYPASVRRLILFNPPMYQDAAQAAATLKSTGLHYRIMLHSPWRDIAWYGAKVLPRIPFNKKRPPINLTDVLRPTTHARQRTYENIILKGEFFNDIAQVKVPTLLVMGKSDRPQYHKNASGWLPPSHVRCVTVSTGHHLPVKHPKLAEQLVRSHL